MMQKTVIKKAKTSPKFGFLVWNANFCYFKDYCLSYNTFAKMKTQNLTIKESKPKKSKIKQSKLGNKKFYILFYINFNKPAKLFY